VSLTSSILANNGANLENQVQEPVRDVNKDQVFKAKANIVVVVVVMTSPSGTAYMGDRCPEEMRNSTRL